MNGNRNNSLDQWVLEDFRQARENRRPLEAKWQLWHDGFHRIVNGYWEPWKSGEGDDWRSDTFVGITRQKVIAFVALVIDIYLAGSKIPFMLKADSGYDESVNTDPNMGGAVDSMQRKVDTQLERTSAERELLRWAYSLGIYGIAWSRKVVREIRIPQRVEVGLDGVADTRSIPDTLRRFRNEMRSVYMPTFEHVPVWNMYWDMETSDVERMGYVYDEEFESAGELRELAGLIGVDESAIDQAIEESTKPGSSVADDMHQTSVDPKLRNIQHRVRTIRHLTRIGRVPRDVFADWMKEHALVDQGEPAEIIDLGNESEGSYGTDGMIEGPKTGEEIYCRIEMAGKHIIRAIEIDPSEMTYEKAACEEDIDSTCGNGIAGNLEDDQHVINGIVRLIEDNTRITGNAQFAGKRRLFINPDEVNQFSPGKFMEISEDCDDARKAIMQLTFTDISAPLINLLNVFLQFAEDDSLILKMSMGLDDQGSQTAFEYSQRSEKSQKYIALIIRNIDRMLEKMLQWMVDFNRDELDPEEAALIGPLRVQALGFSSFQTRVTRLKGMQQLLQILLTSQDAELRARWKTDEIVHEIVKALDVDPEQFERTPQEMEEIAKAQQPAADPNADALGQAQVAEVQARAMAAKADAAHKGAQIVQMARQYGARNAERGMRNKNQEPTTEGTENTESESQPTGTDDGMFNWR